MSETDYKFINLSFLNLHGHHFVHRLLYSIAGSKDNNNVQQSIKN